MQITNDNMETPLELSLVHGIPLAQERGIGALTIPGYLREVTQRYAAREALVMYGVDGIERWSYRELWEHSVAVARALIANGVARDERVGILMTNRLEFLSSLFGVALAGGVAVVFSTFSTQPELEQLLRLSGISLLLFEAQVLKTDFAAMLAQLEPVLRTAPVGVGQLQSERFPFLRHLVCLKPVTQVPAGAISGDRRPGCEAWGSFLNRGAAVTDAVVRGRADSITPSDTGGLFFSSGTTSLPKGILHSQRAFALQWWRYPRLVAIAEPVRCWTANGLFWSGNIAMSVGLTLTSGGTVLLQPYFEADAALAMIERERANFLYGRPHQWARLREAANWAAADLSSLRYIPRGELIREHPTVQTDWEIPMGYGTTETLSMCTSNVYNFTADAVANSFGTPLPGNVLKIVDPQTRAILPVGSSGEICVKGPILMLGYVGKTIEQSFDEDGYFATGDGGHIDAAGRLFFEGRITEIIKTGGANVSPAEVDAALARFPGVRRAQTVGLPHDTLGEMVVSCVVVGEGTTVQEAELIAWLKARLASFKVPKRIVFAAENELEITGSGKIKLERLREIVSQKL